MEISKQADSQDSNQVKLRLPEGMRPQIKIMAAQNRRTMNSELVYLLERGMQAVNGERNAH